ncbi:SDR family NAD(P)-dependent oxidoreductase [Bradyrhizobium sp.]|uniref:SDR family NAD(P)-dependent oxidoreductase n=1 Tax=Bradyrhizobium sp. TaxID=376 RepID=UPI0039E629C6
MTQLKGKVAVVTGASRGIGEAIVRKLASQGAHVALTYKLQKDKADAVVESIKQDGGSAIALRADAVDKRAIQEAMDEAGAYFGKIDILVNNAGMLRVCALEEIDFAFYAEQFNVHVWGTIAATQAALKHFPKEGGTVINLSSLRVYQPAARSSIYSASKAAVSTLTQALAVELGPRGITVNAVAPGITRTDMTAAMPDERRRMIADVTPLRRLGEPGDIASAVALLASDDARWITGRTLLADGGFIGT